MVLSYFWHRKELMQQRDMFREIHYYLKYWPGASYFTISFNLFCSLEFVLCVTMIALRGVTVDMLRLIIDRTEMEWNQLVRVDVFISTFLSLQ